LSDLINQTKTTSGNTNDEISNENLKTSAKVSDYLNDIFSCRFLIKSFLKFEALPSCDCLFVLYYGLEVCEKSLMDKQSFAFNTPYKSTLYKRIKYEFALFPYIKY